MKNKYKIVKISILGIDETADSEWFEIRFLNMFGCWKPLRSSNSTGAMDFISEVLKFQSLEEAETFAINLKSKNFKSARIEEDIKIL